MASIDYVNDLFGLDGKVALITGGGGVLGSALAEALGRAGAKVAITDLSQEKAHEVERRLRGQGVAACGLSLDAFDKDAIAAVLATVEEKLGIVDILVNMAGGNVAEATVSDDRSFFDLPAAALEKVVGLNLFAGALYPTQVIGKRMCESKRPGSIINISSMNAFRPLTRIVGYSAAKAAVSNATLWLSVYFAKDLKSAVRVNALAPGFFLTDQNRRLLTNPDGSMTARGNTILDHTPMGRYGEAADLMGAAIWLASDASAFVTGVVLPIDGGFSAFSGV